MNDMILAGAEPLTMSSKEIADLLDVRHDKVKQSIERLVNKEVILLPPMGEAKITKSNGAQQPITVYLLEKRDSYVVVAQLSPEFTARVVDRWQELEAKTSLQLPNFSDPAAAARAWADQVEQNKALALESQQQAETIGHMKPVVDEYANLTCTDDLISVEDFNHHFHLKRGKAMSAARRRGLLHIDRDKVLVLGLEPHIRSGGLGVFREVDAGFTYRRDGSDIAKFKIFVIKKKMHDLARLAVYANGRDAFVKGATGTKSFNRLCHLMSGLTKTDAIAFDDRVVKGFEPHDDIAAWVKKNASDVTDQGVLDV